MQFLEVIDINTSVLCGQNNCFFVNREWLLLIDLSLSTIRILFDFLTFQNVFLLFNNS